MLRLRSTYVPVVRRTYIRHFQLPDPDPVQKTQNKDGSSKSAIIRE